MSDSAIQGRADSERRKTAGVSPAVHPDDLAFFATLAGSASLTAAAREMGVSTAAVSKHLGQMEARVQLALVNRTTRRMSLTPEGELYLSRARKILADISDLADVLGASRAGPKGLLRVNATLGFGRSHIAPVLSRFVRAFPEVDVQLQLSVDPPSLHDDAFDVCIRFGEPPDARVIARRLAPNRRLLCASPEYLAGRVVPRVPQDLTQHNCIGIRQGDDGYGIWRLTPEKGSAAKTEAVRVRGNLTTNDGEIAVKWALEGHGILLRAEWDIRAYLADGSLLPVLPGYRTPGADIFAVYLPHQPLAARVRAFVDFVQMELGSAASLLANPS